eukprot:TRINITY_DN1816_c0_g1_i1.p1 TRINITY_DN1816_c0_g1~~TRINITY_DN1816_c0_g1_i1.p1  ORF type:complete len:1295 (-),score=235.72 TRINITY_DN1816_c0_g1_i1:43-3522(-)
MNSPCGPHATCTTPKIGFRECKCENGYYFRNLGSSGVIFEDLTDSIQIQGSATWASTGNECVDIPDCEEGFTNPPRNTFGCNPHNSSILTSCEDRVGGRVCSCPEGYYMPNFGVSGFIPQTIAFPGCTPNDNCNFDGAYGCGTTLYSNLPVTCETVVSDKVCTCPVGYNAVDSTKPSVTLKPQETFRGCVDVDECVGLVASACGDNAECDDPIPGYRTCKCKPGFHFASDGSSGLSYSQLNGPEKTVFGRDEWNHADECVENNNCDVHLEHPYSGGYGCGLSNYNGQSVGCGYNSTGRTCTCPAGFVITGSDNTSIFLPSYDIFPGCTAIDACAVYGYDRENAECVNSDVNQRTITCKAGLYAQAPFNPSIKIDGSAAFVGCQDINECIFRCDDHISNATVSCEDSIVSGGRIALNERVCTCPVGYGVYGEDDGPQSTTLISSALFSGCVDCSPCPFNTYMSQPCNATSSRVCTACAHCAAGEYVETPCSVSTPTQCAKCTSCGTEKYISKACTESSNTECRTCDPTCGISFIEAVPCANGKNRVCVAPGAPVCEGGCGTGECVADNVCRCQLSKGYYGANCENNCHDTCGKFSATCDVSTDASMWWCTCPPGFFPSADGRQCFEVGANYPRCEWEAWGPWSSCGVCGGTAIRQAKRGENADAMCAEYFPQSKVCDQECMSLTFDQETEISRVTSAGTAIYAAMSLASFWKNEGAKFMATKHNITISLSANPDEDAFRGVFRLWILNPAMTTISKRQSNDENADCLNDKNRIATVFADMTNQTMNFLVEVRKMDAESIQTELKDECVFSVQVNVPGDVYPGIIGGIIGGLSAVILILALVLLWYTTRPLDLSSLPSPVRWQYEQYQQSSSQWSVMGKGEGKYYRKKLDEGGNEWENMEKLFFGYLQASDIMISEAYAIYNPTLITSFINQKNILAARLRESPDVFFNDAWKRRGNKEKEFVCQEFQKRVAETGWNEKETIPIIPCVHGTDFSLAMAICSTGFAALSALDAGWYGSGVYFTTYASYTITYFSTRKDPAIIISYVTPGHVFPVTEAHTAQSNSLLGTVLKSSYNSHYVVVQSDGTVPDYDAIMSDNGAEKIGLWDEIVVSQEPQITPVYVLRISTKNMNHLLRTWDRTKKDPSTRERIKRSKSKTKNGGGL